MDAAAYYRVSSLAQDLGLQRHACERAAAGRGDVISKVYEEKASARTTDRPVLQQLRTDALAGRLRRLYLFRLDRLCRSGILDTLALIKELRGAGVEIVSIREDITISGPIGEFLIAGLALGAQLERLAGEERRAAARARRQAEGRGWGRPRKFDLDDERLVQAEAMKKEGRSIRDIAQVVKIKRPTLQRRLQERALQQKEERPGVEPDRLGGVASKLDPGAAPSYPGGPGPATEEP